MSADVSIPYTPTEVRYREIILEAMQRYSDDRGTAPYLPDLVGEIARKKPELDVQVVRRMLRELLPRLVNDGFVRQEERTTGSGMTMNSYMRLMR